MEVIRGNASLPDTVYWEWHHSLIDRATASSGANGDSPGADNRPGAGNRGYYALWLKDTMGQTKTSEWRTLGIRRRTKILNIVGVERIPIFLFGFGEHRLGRYSKQFRMKLRDIADKLDADPQATCLLRGHTDSVGDQLGNRWLSIQRAKTVYDMLARMGIARSRMSYVGFGEEQPLGDNSLPEGRTMNRRVEVFIRHSPNWSNAGGTITPTTGSLPY